MHRPGIHAIRPIGSTQCQLNQMIGKMRVLGKERTMHVRPKSVTVDRPFSSIFRIIAVSLEYFSQWFGGTQIGTTTMILETNQRTAIPVDRDISDTPRCAGTLMNRPGV